MYLSIFTPTHNLQHLRALCDSLRAQVFKGSYEFVIVCNGPVQPEHITDSYLAGLPAKVIRADNLDGKIGALKRFAIDHCQGEVFIEVDHDDLLTPNALASIEAAFVDHPDCGFVYSDFAEFEDGTFAPHAYSPAYGWTFREEDHLGHRVRVMNAFDPTAHAMTSVLYAPNHIRAWKRETYQQAGGHDISLSIGDDYDLVCRTYLTTRMYHIPECLYLYRRKAGATGFEQFEGNTYSLPDRSQELFNNVDRIRGKYLDDMVLRWAKLSNLRTIDICSGPTPAEGYEGYDKYGTDHVQAVDLSQRWPFDDNSIGVFRCFDALEHLPAVHTMRELHRCLVPGGWVLSLTPSAEGRGAFQDPGHISFWVSNSFWYYTKKDYQKFLDFGPGAHIPIRFQQVRLVDFHPTNFHTFHKIPYVRSDLVKLAEGYRAPGITEI